METGIEKIKEALNTCIEVGTKIDQALVDDGKISIVEGIGIGIKALKFIQVAKNIKEIKAEFFDLDENEKTELKLFVAAKLELSNKEAEMWIEKAFDTLLEIYGFFFNESIKTMYWIN